MQAFSYYLLLFINPLNTKHMFYIRTQRIPHSKHCASRLYGTSLLMFLQGKSRCLY
jgi:hypothetical protein